jgi:hypothetical protein
LASFLLKGSYHFPHEAGGPANVEGVFSAVLDSSRDQLVHRHAVSISDKRRQLVLAAGLEQVFEGVISAAVNVDDLGNFFLWEVLKHGYHRGHPDPCAYEHRFLALFWCKDSEWRGKHHDVALDKVVMHPIRHHTAF